MKYKHIEAAREVRLWIGQIVVLAVTLAATLAATTLAIPEVRQAVAAKAKLVKEDIDKKLNKQK